LFSCAFVLTDEEEGEEEEEEEEEEDEEVEHGRLFAAFPPSSFFLRFVALLSIFIAARLYTNMLPGTVICNIMLLRFKIFFHQKKKEKTHTISNMVQLSTYIFVIKNILIYFGSQISVLLL
jgi:hypothetical protein